MANQYCNFVDVLAYALTLVDSRGTSRFVSEPATWQKTIFEAKNKFSDRLPFLRQLVFDDRPYRSPYSSEVEHFIHVMLQSLRFEELDAGYRFTQRSKQLFMAGKEPPGDETALVELSELLSARLVAA